jgi:hypothetical protein
MMSATLIVSGALVALMPATASASTQGIAPAIEKCVRENVSAVETTVPNLNDAVSFLIDDVCAQPIAEEESRQGKLMEQQSEAQTRKRCNELKAKKQPTQIDKLVLDTCSENSGAVGYTGVTLYGAAQRPALATSLAAHLLLNLRMTHLKSGTSR